ncbi:hypothetical protein CFBP6600_32220 [Xanthomonas arboricola pv. corylina]|uniref:hypothetical protein n=1 Tax=Xanthomonas arboricola TaxID=56448 RepID=UPI001CE52696|nr:hypothetical protein [Xanthomonas arboricola]CAE6816274.1 hypothetical protein CFBP6600_32220 [Xanthomonas arboricola pv. corylina]CAE6816290.1 hypothetical protein CFBP6600_32220 [Xanthomonas arboricola pv. corylina]
MSNNPSPEELRRLQELAEMFDDVPSISGTPSPERSAPSPGASEVMNAAKHWGRVFGSKAKELSKMAVEKSKEAQDAIARRAAEAKAKREAEREQDTAAAIPTAAPTEMLQVEPEAIPPPVVTETMVESEDEAALLERVAPMEANAKKAAKEIAKALRENPAVAALIYDGMGTLPQLRDLPDEGVDPVTPDQQSPSVPESIPPGGARRISNARPCSQQRAEPGEGLANLGRGCACCPGACWRYGMVGHSPRFRNAGRACRHANRSGSAPGCCHSEPGSRR